MGTNNMNRTIEGCSIDAPRASRPPTEPAVLTAKNVYEPVASILPFLQAQPSHWYPTISLRLEDLLELPPNWDSYGADPCSPEIVASARGLLLSLGRIFDLPAPVISPTRTGGILLEWSSGSLELEIQLVSRDAASFVCSDVATGRDIEGCIFTDSLYDEHLFDSLERLSL